jgi:chromosome partitioning protein
MKVISIINCKGGVGKTTLTACIGQALSLIGQRVLVIDNDSQHNLSLMLGGSNLHGATIRDIYHATLGNMAQRLADAIHTTELPNLDLLPACGELCNADIRDREVLKKCFAFCRLNQRYDVILIDNPPGLDKLQEAAICAADELFVPTELSHFAFSGIANLQQMLARRFGPLAARTRIIPNFFRDTHSQNAYLQRLQETYAGAVTRTAIPYDVVHEDCLIDNQFLFLHRHESRVIERYLALVLELFKLDKDIISVTIVNRNREELEQSIQERFCAEHAPSTRRFFPYSEDDWDPAQETPCEPASRYGSLPFYL